MINETFSEVEVYPQFDSDMNGSEWCTECMVGNNGTPQPHTCEPYQDVLDAIRETDTSILVVVENRLLADEPVEFLKWNKLREESLELEGKRSESFNTLSNTKQEVERLSEYNNQLKEEMFTLQNDLDFLAETRNRLVQDKWELIREVNAEKGKITIGGVTLSMTSSDLQVLIENTIKLECLERDGVDNWEWYGESFLSEEEMLEEVNNRISKYKVTGLS